MSPATASSLRPSSRQARRSGCFGSSPPCSSCGRSARRSRHAAMRPGRVRTSSARAVCAASISRDSATARRTRASSPSAASSLSPSAATRRWPGACSAGTPLSAARSRSACHARSNRPASSRSRVRSSVSTALSRPARAPGTAWRWWATTRRAASPSTPSRVAASRSAAPSSRQAACWGSSSMGSPCAWAAQPSSGQRRQWPRTRSTRPRTSRSRARCPSCSASMVSTKRRMSSGRSSICASAAARAITSP